MSDNPWQEAAPEVRDPVTDSRTAMWAGIVAICCAAVGPCFCYVPYFIALPAAAAALLFAYRAVHADVENIDRTPAYGGIVTGIVGGALSLAVLAVVFIYALVVVVGVAAGGMIAP